MTAPQERNVPALRFPDFSGEWKSKKLSTVNTQMQSGLSRLLKDNDIGLPVIRSNNIVGDKLDISDIKYWYMIDPQGANTKNYFLEEGDLLINFINSIAQIGKVALYENILDRDVILTTNLMRLKFIDDIEPKFIFNFFLTEKYRSHIHSITKPAVNQASFTTKDLGKFIIPLPKYEEQQKIASFLSSVDTKTEQLGEKKDLLEQYKKGMMQKLFSQALRFKDEQGNDFPDWVEKRLGEFGETYGGLTGKTKENFGSGVPYIQYMQIFSSSKININKCGFVEIEQGERQKLVQYGDVFFTTSSETVMEIGTTSVLLDTVTKMYLNSFCFGYRPDLNILEPKFLQFAFREPGFRKMIVRLAQGSTRFNMSKVALMKLSFSVPSMDEQQKIANFLSALDQKIDLIATELDQAKTFKKGLLQQMFI